MEHEKSTENQILSGKLGKYDYSDKKYDNFVCPGESRCRSRWTSTADW